MKLISVDRTFPYLDKLYRLNEQAFPPAERIPSRRLLSVAENAGCHIWALCGEGTDPFAGFAVVLADEDARTAYLWYLAVEPSLRSRGLGGLILRKLRDRYEGSQLVADIERQDPMAKNGDQRRRRLEFYIRNGWSRTGWGMTYYGVDYEILAVGAPFCPQRFSKVLDSMRQRGFRAWMYPLISE